MKVGERLVVGRVEMGRVESRLGCGGFAAAPAVYELVKNNLTSNRPTLL